MLSTVIVLMALAQAAGAPQAPPVEEAWPPAGVQVVNKAVTAPRLIRDAKPRYTAGAMDAQIQGAVSMQVIVEADGTVSRVRVSKSLDKQYGLDDEAVRAVKTWRFAPGRKDGVAVPVMVDIEMTFTLNGKQ